jgi:hypothetical protein
MNKGFFGFLLMLLLTVVSCKSSPETAAEPKTSFAGEEKQDAAAAGDAGGGENSGSGIDETGTEALPADGGGTEEIPFVEVTPEEPPEPVLAEDLREPDIDLAEADTAAVPPAEDKAGAALPEPVPEQEPAPPALEPPPARQGPPDGAAPPRPAEVPPPPPFLGPAEELPPPGREPVPAPARSQPEPPVITPVPSKPEEEIVFSRRVRAMVGQLVEIPYRGTGWVYLGEITARRGLVYDSRRLDPEGQSFVFRIEAAGTYALKFYKQDFIRDFILNDYVQVTAGEAPETAGSGWFNPPLDRGRVVAEPRWPTSLEEAEILRRGGRPAAGLERAGGTASAPSAESAAAGQGTAGRAGSGGNGASPPSEAPPDSPGASSAAAQLPAPSSTNDEGVVPARPPVSAGQAPESPELPADLSPADYIRKAREEFEAGRVASAISVLDQFRERYPSGSDEAYWLYGQFYEANSPGRDILRALDNYRRLVREYPQSGHYNDARRRIAYLERYYINIQ